MVNRNGSQHGIISLRNPDADSKTELIFNQRDLHTRSPCTGALYFFSRAPRKAAGRHTAFALEGSRRVI